MSRPFQGGEEFRMGLQAERHIKSRLSIVRVLGVDVPTQRVRVGPIRSSEVFWVNVPFAALSLRSAATATWARRMPQVGDTYLMGWSVDSQPFLIAACSGDIGSGDAPGVATGASPRDNLVQTASSAAASARLGGTAPSIREFVPLEPGEFDERSVGGAYIKGDRFGVLTTGSGTVRRTQESREGIDDGRADTHIWRGLGFDDRIGQVRRLVLTPTDGVPPAVLALLGKQAAITPLVGLLDPTSLPATALATAAREGHVDVTLPTGGSITLADWADGDIRDALGTQDRLVVPLGRPTEQVSSLLALRGRRRYYSVDGSVTSELQVDHSGNVDLSTNGAVQVHALRLSLHATGPNVVGSSQAVAGVLLGSSSAGQSYVLGDAFAAADKTQETAVQAAFTTLAGVMNALSGVLIALGQPGAATVVSAAATPFNDAAAALGVYIGQIDSRVFLSEKIKGEK